MEALTYRIADQRAPLHPHHILEYSAVHAVVDDKQKTDAAASVFHLQTISY